MYRDVAQWQRIRRLVLDEGVPRKKIVRDHGICRNTVRKMLLHPLPPASVRLGRRPKIGPYTSEITRRLAEAALLPPSARESVRGLYERLLGDGFEGTYRTTLDYVRQTSREGCVWELAYDLIQSLDRRRAIDFLFHLSQPGLQLVEEKRAADALSRAERVLVVDPVVRMRDKARAFVVDWLSWLSRGRVSLGAVRYEISYEPALARLLDQLRAGTPTNRKRALIILGQCRGLPLGITREFAGVSRQAARRYRALFRDGGCDALFARRKVVLTKRHDEALKSAIFRLLHEPPASHGYNRTSWKMQDLCDVLRETGTPACLNVVRSIIRDAGYRWRKARVVLTSTDPEYSAKLAHIQSILSTLQTDEAFFSIDEFGPFAVKAKPGLSLAGPGEEPTVPQWQKSRGCLILTAALELSSNQVTHFYSAKKNTAEMIRMMDMLVEHYADRRKIYLSWDAASWHISKRLQAHIDAHNAERATISGPTVETAPLPSGAQFLNVIESVFSGMARAIIHNSDYRTVDDAKAAIGRYFADRNAQFRKHPYRAGRKIWGKEPEPAAFSDASNCKDARYR